MNIGEASRRSAVSAKMIRHYESLNLLPPVARSASGYRQYDDAAIHTLRFIRRARELGFSMREIEALLGLWRNRRRASADVKAIALAHAADLQRRILGMQTMQRTLEHLAHECQGNERPECPILDDLGGHAPSPGA
jgi:MerR family copper efflux transcriptional regulator